MLYGPSSKHNEDFTIDLEIKNLRWRMKGASTFLLDGIDLTIRSGQVPGIGLDR